MKFVKDFKAYKPAKNLLNFGPLMKNARLRILLQIITALICLFPGLTGYSQVCTGSLGDPVVSVTFGGGGTNGNPLPAATTTYTFTSSICPNDGFYTIVSSTAGCFGSSWHTLTEDHTPNDANGYMMLINASLFPGDFYVDTVTNLCGNTKYEFGAWVTNVLLPSASCPSHIRPKLTFNIETITGTILGTYSTGDILETSAPTWLQYGLFFSMPVNSNAVVIRITNDAPGGCGNDLALDDITFRPCGPTVDASVINSSMTSIDLCSASPTPVPITATIGRGYTAPSFQWQTSSNNGITWSDIPGQTTGNYIFNGTAAGLYQLRLTVAEGSNITSPNCRVASNVITITIHDAPVVSASTNSPVCEGAVLNLNATGGTVYNWTGPSGFTSASDKPSVIAQTNLTGLYNVVVKDQYGCINQASTAVVVNPKPVITISNTQTVCEGVPVPLLASGGNTYLWYPSTGLSATDIANPIASPVDTTTYFVVGSGNNCNDTASVIINILKKPFASAGPDKILLSGQSTLLDGVAAGSNVSYYWSPAQYLDFPLALQPQTSPLNDIKYTLHVSSNAGCGIAEDDVFVKVYNDIYVPNAFSPNHDGLNDTWRIDGLQAAPNARVFVFNRYGKIVFETTGNNSQWDGTYRNNALPVGSYTYMIDLKNGRKILKGTVILVR